MIQTFSMEFSKIFMIFFGEILRFGQKMGNFSEKTLKWVNLCLMLSFGRASLELAMIMEYLTESKYCIFRQWQFNVPLLKRRFSNEISARAPSKEFETANIWQRKNFCKKYHTVPRKVREFSHDFELKIQKNPFIRIFLKFFFTRKASHP